MISKITFIGAGNVANVLGRQFLNAGYDIRQVYSKHEEHALQTARRLNARAINHLDDLDSNSDVYFISVKDDAIREIAGKFRLPAKIVVHTSGTVPSCEIEPVSSRYGVFYPLQTLREEKEVSLQDVPVLIYSPDDVVLEELRRLAVAISTNPKVKSDEQREKIHLAAVILNNFTNHLAHLSAEILHEEGEDFSLLIPLLKETVSNLTKEDPLKTQTGPAVRKDMKTIERHISLLKEKHGIKKIYKAITESIIEMARVKNL